jgi:phenylacetate-CoA ligase
MPSWDRRTPKQQAKVRDAALRRQLRDAVGPFSPFWRERFTALRVPAASVKTAADLAKLPAVGERDVCPSGDPADAARLVLQADEAGFALHAYGPQLRKALLHRLTGRAAYRRQVEAQTRPTTFHFAGRSIRFPIASTRNDLDVVARAGARAWSVLGLTNADVLVSAVPVAPSLDHVFLTYAALGAGAPALFPGADTEAVAGALRLVPATVLAVRPEDAVDLLNAVDLGGVRTVLLVGAPTAEVRDAVVAAAGDRTVLGLWGPDEGRVLWAQCAEGGANTGWHTYPDLDLVELVDPETGAATKGPGGEVTVTQLGLRGSALLRWRTGDVVDAAIANEPCPACGRTVPRLSSEVRTSHLHVRVTLRHSDGEEHVDLRAVAGALAGRNDLADWMVEVVPSPREHESDLVIFVAPTGDETDAAVGAYRDVRAVAGVTPSQVVVVTPEELAARRPPADTGAPRVVVRR